MRATVEGMLHSKFDDPADEIEFCTGGLRALERTYGEPASWPEGHRAEGLYDEFSARLVEARKLIEA